MPKFSSKCGHSGQKYQFFPDIAYDLTFKILGGAASYYLGSPLKPSLKWSSFFNKICSIYVCVIRNHIMLCSIEHFKTAGTFGT